MKTLGRGDTDTGRAQDGLSDRYGPWGDPKQTSAPGKLEPTQQGRESGGSPGEKRLGMEPLRKTVVGMDAHRPFRH